MALVFAQLGERRLRDRACGAARSAAGRAARAAPVPRDRPARPDRRRRVPAAAARLRDIFTGVPRRPRRVPRRRPAAAIRSSRCWRPTSGAASIWRSLSDRRSTTRDGAGRVPRARSIGCARYFLTQDGKPRGEQVHRHRLQRRRLRLDRRVEAASRPRRRRSRPPIAEAIRAFRRDLNVVLSRGVWRMFAVALQQYQRTLEAHALLDFSGVLERAVELLKEMDEFAREPLPARSALPPRAGRRVPGHQPRAVGARRAAGAGAGAKGFGAAADALPPSIFIVGDRKQSIYGFRDADVAVLDEAAAFIEALRPDGSAAAGDLGQLPIGARSCWRSSTSVRARSSTASADASAARRVPLRRARSVSVDAGDAATDAAETARPSRLAGPWSASSPANRARGGRARRRRDRAAARPATTVRDRTTGVARDGEPGRHRHPVPLARQPPRVRGGARAPRRLDLRLQGPRLLRRRRDPGRGGAAALSRRSAVGPARRGVAAIAHRAAVRRRRCASRRRALAAADPERRTAAGDARTARRRGSRACSSCFARAVPALAGAGSIALPPSELLDAVLRETAYAFELRGPRRRQARENLKKLRGAGPARPEPRLRHAGARSPTISTGSPSATSRTPPSTRSTPSA